MKKIKMMVLTLLFVSSISIYAQQMTTEEYISKYYDLAVEEMNSFRIPASITLAQGIHESNSGNSRLATKANNHFGIKCKKDWTGMTIYHDDDLKQECFRAYHNVEESYRDHSQFLQRDRYETLFTYDIQDYKSWAYGLKDAGYATNPKYPQILIKLIEDYKLYRFDSYGLSTNSRQYNTTLVDKTQNVSPTETIGFGSALGAGVSALANNLKAVYVSKTFDIEALAKENKTTVEKLMEYNDLTGEQNMKQGQNFFLEPKKAHNDKKTHTVEKGESLYDISQMYGVKLESLKKYNKLGDYEQPAVGEYIALMQTLTHNVKKRYYYEVQEERMGTAAVAPPADNTTPTQVVPATPNANIPSGVKVEKITGNLQSYTVKDNDSVFKIAKQFNCSPSDILNWNNLKIEDELKPGQELIILK